MTWLRKVQVVIQVVIVVVLVLDILVLPGDNWIEGFIGGAF